MNAETRQTRSCTRAETQDHTHLCCCIAVDENGHYVDPCYSPVGEKTDDRCKPFGGYRQS